MHRIRLEYYDYGAAEGLEVSVKLAGKTKVKLPAAWLRHVQR